MLVCSCWENLLKCDGMNCGFSILLVSWLQIVLNGEVLVVVYVYLVMFYMNYGLLFVIVCCVWIWCSFLIELVVGIIVIVLLLVYNVNVQKCLFGCNVCSVWKVVFVVLVIFCWKLEKLFIVFLFSCFLCLLGYVVCGLCVVFWYVVDCLLFGCVLVLGCICVYCLVFCLLNICMYMVVVSVIVVDSSIIVSGRQFVLLMVSSVFVNDDSVVLLLIVIVLVSFDVLFVSFGCIDIVFVWVFGLFSLLLMLISMYGLNYVSVCVVLLNISVSLISGFVYVMICLFRIVVVNVQWCVFCVVSMLLYMKLVVIVFMQKLIFVGVMLNCVFVVSGVLVRNVQNVFVENVMYSVQVQKWCVWSSVGYV